MAAKLYIWVDKAWRYLNLQVPNKKLPLWINLVNVTLRGTEWAAADPGGGQGGHNPPVPVKTSHKKDARHRLPLIFHVSWPSPSDHPGSDADEEVSIFVQIICKQPKLSVQYIQGEVTKPIDPSINHCLYLWYLRDYWTHQSCRN